MKWNSWCRAECAYSRFGDCGSDSTWRSAWLVVSQFRCQSSARRMRLRRERRFFASRRRDCAALEGRVGRRMGGGAVLASARIATIRVMAALRFCHWERCSDAVTRNSPAVSLVRNRCRTRARRCAGTLAAWVTSNTTCTRESVVLTPWPPGPDEREKVQVSSRAGITHSGVTRISESNPRWPTSGPYIHGGPHQDHIGCGRSVYLTRTVSAGASASVRRRAS